MTIKVITIPGIAGTIICSIDMLVKRVKKV